MVNATNRQKLFLNIVLIAAIMALVGYIFYKHFVTPTTTTMTFGDPPATPASPRFTDASGAIGAGTAFYNGAPTSYLKYDAVPPISATGGGSLEAQFVTIAPGPNFLLAVYDAVTGSYVVLWIDATGVGSVNASSGKGGGSMPITYSAPLGPYRVNGGLWHDVRLSIDASTSTVSIYVDSVLVASPSTAFPSIGSASSPPTLYVGGHDNEAPALGSFGSPFVGCIRSVIVNGTYAATFDGATTNGGTVVAGCPIER